MANPLEQFVIKPVLPLHIGGFDLSLTNSGLYMIITTLTIGALMWAGLRKPALVPGRVQGFVELLHDALKNLVANVAGQKALPFFPFVFSLFLFILIGNMWGLMPVPGVFTFTSHLSVTLALALTVFIMVIVVGILKNGMRFFTLFLPHGTPLLMAPLIIIIEVVSFCARPISLSLRLFVNMMAGHMVLKIFALLITMLIGAGGALMAVGIFPLALTMALSGFEFLVCLIQAMIFTIFTCIYLHDAIYLHGDTHVNDHDHEPVHAS